MFLAHDLINPKAERLGGTAELSSQRLSLVQHLAADSVRAERIEVEEHPGAGQGVASLSADQRLERLTRRIDRGGVDIQMRDRAQAMRAHGADQHALGPERLR